MLGVPVVGVEPVVEPAERDGVQGKAVMSTGTLTSSSGLSRDHLPINCPAMSSIRGMYSRIACWLKGAIRMLCARCHIGSVVSLVKNRDRPRSSAGPSGRHRSSCRRSCRRTFGRPDRHPTPYLAPAGRVNLKIGPYSLAMAIKPSIGLCVSMSNMLPSSGSPLGPGISSIVIGAVIRTHSKRLRDALGKGIQTGRPTLRVAGHGGERVVPGLSGGDLSATDGDRLQSERHHRMGQPSA